MRKHAFVSSTWLCLVLFFCVGSQGFAENLSRVRRDELGSLKKKGKQSNWTFEVGYHEVLDRAPELATGLVLPDESSESPQFVSPSFQVAELPAKWDWREQVGGLTPIKNQGSCGSCWAFATAAVMESQLKIRDNVVRNVSEQHLLSCNTDGWSCRGGWFAHKLHVSPGVVYGADFPYLARSTRCDSRLSFHEKLEDWAYLGNQGSKPSDLQIKAAILKYGPVGVTIAATRSFMSYRSGVYNACDGRRTNHAVSLVGWNDDEKAWILRNSWGESWGDKGYMRIRYGCNNVGERTTFVNYKATCNPQPIAFTGDSQTLSAGEATTLGDMAIPGQKYTWTPADGLDDPTISMPTATPAKTTKYTLEVENSCGRAQATTTVTVK